MWSLRNKKNCHISQFTRDVTNSLWVLVCIPTILHTPEINTLLNLLSVTPLLVFTDFPHMYVSFKQDLILFCTPLNFIWMNHIEDTLQIAFLVHSCVLNSNHADVCSFSLYLFFTAGWYFISWAYHDAFIPFWVHRHLHCFQVFSIISLAWKHILVYACKQSSWIRSYAYFHFPEKCQIIFWSDFVSNNTPTISLWGFSLFSILAKTCYHQVFNFCQSGGCEMISLGLQLAFRWLIMLSSIFSELF